MLIDMKNDPGEMKNLAHDAAWRTELDNHRNYLRAYAAQTADEEAGRMLPAQRP